MREIFAKWDVPCAEIGRVTDDGMMRVRNQRQCVGGIPAKPLAEEARCMNSRPRDQPRIRG